MTTRGLLSMGASFAVGILLGATLFQPHPEGKVAGVGPSLTRTEKRGPVRSAGNPEGAVLVDSAERDRKLEEALKHGVGDEFTGGWLAGNLALKDLPWAEEQIKLRLKGGFRQMFLSGFLGGWTVRDPGGLIRHLMGTPGRLDPGEVGAVTQAIFHLAQRDPQEALALVDSLRGRPGFGASDLRSRALHGMALSQPDEVLRRIDEVPLATRDQVRKSAWSGIARSDPTRLATMLESGQIPTTLHDFYMAAALEGWPESDFASAVDWVRKLVGTGTSSPQRYASIAAEIAEAHPAGALQMLESLAPEAVAGADWQRVLEGVGAKDPTLVRRWFDSRSNPQERAIAAGVYAPLLAATDPSHVDPWITAITDPIEQSKTVLKVAMIWADSDPGAAWDWLLRRDPDSTGNARMTVVDQWFHSDPAAAADAFQTLPAATRQQTLKRTVSDWVETQPEQAARMVSENLDSPRSAESVDVIVRRWALSDSDATGAWINTLPEGPLRERAVESLLGIVDGFDVGLAWKWALTISDPEKRLTQLGNLGQRWMASDPVQAGAAIGAVELPLDLRNRLLKPNGR